MTHLKHTLIILLSLLSISVFSQSIIRGSVIDEGTGEALIGVAVIIDGTTKGAYTDLDGQFQIMAEPGTYKVNVSFISYQRLQIENVVVKENEVTAMGVIKMGSSAEQLKAVVVEAKAVRNTEAALVTMKKKSANLIDGISAASFKKVGDSDAAGAMSRVTGVSVQGGKYVYVRGLGDRYTKTTLNGMDVPGLDPDRNTVQMDIFPTNIIDNIVVSKSFTADLPADFTGGAVDIELKDFPEKKSSSISAGIGFNPAMHFNSNYITYDKPGADILGFGASQRKNPAADYDVIPQYGDVIGNVDSPEGQTFLTILNGFDPQMGGYRKGSLLNGDLGFSYTDQIAKSEEKSLGYSVSLNYSNDVEYYEGAEFNLYGKDQNPDNTELTPLNRRTGDFGVNNVLLGGMFGLAQKTSKSKVRLNVLHLQNGESKAGIFTVNSTNLGSNFTANQFNLEYSQRSLTNVLLAGKHSLDAEGWTLEWKLSPTRSAIEDPDIRVMRYRAENNSIGSEVGLPERIWRSLTEYNIAGKGDATKKHKLMDRDAKLKVGLSHTFKTRDFNIENFKIFPNNYRGDGEPNNVFQQENLFSADNPQGVIYQADFYPFNTNKFSSYVNHSGVYVSEEFNPTEVLKAIVGVRAEKYTQYYTGINQQREVLDNEKVLDATDFFPTVNLIYSLTDKTNLRASFSRTIARPSFKEMSFAEIVDPITGRRFSGGLIEETSGTGADLEVLWDGNLTSTYIQNYDLRWETYPNVGQTIAISGFYKRFKDPIEMVQLLVQPGNFQARNVGDATVAGAEIEIIQSLAQLSEKLKNYQFNANFTYAYSQVDMSESEIRSRTLSARTGENVETTRQMAGQAPYLLNVGFSYNNREQGAQASLTYNVQGRTLQFVGFGNQTDVYSVPFHSLNLKLGKSFGKDDKWNGSFKVTNILNDMKEQVFSNYMADDQYFTRLRPQRTFSFSVSYKLF